MLAETFTPRDRIGRLLAPLSGAQARHAGLALALGLLVGFMVLGARPLNPFDTSWIAGDAAISETGFMFMRRAALLVFPLTWSPALGYPFGAATANLTNNGPHGFSEILYAYTSTNGNNGSAFGGLSGNTPWYNFSLGLAMLIGRFLFIIPMLAVAGSLAGKRKIPVTDGTLPTHGPLFVGLLIGTVIIVGALTYFPALSLGPIVEHFLMQQGKLFSMVSFSIWS